MLWRSVKEAGVGRDLKAAFLRWQLSKALNTELLLVMYNSPVPVITMLCVEPRTLSTLGWRYTSLILGTSLVAVVSGFSYLRLTIVQKYWLGNSRNEEFSSLNEVIWMTISYIVQSRTQWDSHAICTLPACWPFVPLPVTRWTHPNITDSCV